MKNIYIYLTVAAAALLMMVASTCLLTVADEGVRQACGYVSLVLGGICTWCTAKMLLDEEKREEQHHTPVHVN